jgi:tRNA A22 N-methylase
MGGIKMSALIEEFKREHSEIVAILNKAKELGILSKEGQVTLMSVKASLLEHLWNENERLYPVLWKAAERDKDLKELLDLFAIGMEDVSNVAQRFFDKFYEGTLDKNFQHEFEEFFVTISKRIKNEEEILYDEYEKIAQ